MQRCFHTCPGFAEGRSTYTESPAEGIPKHELLGSLRPASACRPMFYLPSPVPDGSMFQSPQVYSQANKFLRPPHASCTLPGVLSSTNIPENLEIQLNNSSYAVLLPPAHCKYFLFEFFKKKKGKEKKRNCLLRFHWARSN